MGLEQNGDVGRPGDPIHRHDREQHEERAGKRIEEELEGRVDPPLAAPYADDEKHRDKAALEEYIKQHEIERAEDANDKGLKHKERDKIFLDPGFYRIQGSKNADRQQKSGQQHEGKGDAVDPHLVDEAIAEPALFLDELKARSRGVEPRIGIERQPKDDEGRRQSGPAGIVECRLVIPPEREDKGCANERQKDDAGKNPEAKHQRIPAAKYQVITAARPTSMAKA